MTENKKLHGFLVALLVISLSFGSIGVGIFANAIAHDLQTSSVRISKTSKKKIARRITKNLIAQYTNIEIPENMEIYNCTFEPPEKPEYKGEFIQSETRVNVLPGNEFQVSLYLKNTGNVTWFGSSSKCAGMNPIKLGTARERDHLSNFYSYQNTGWLEAARIAMVEPRVEPGQIGTFTFRSKAPETTDIFREYFQPVVEGKQWMERKEETAHVDIAVGVVPETYEQALFYLGNTGAASFIDPNAPTVVEVDISEQTMRFKLGDVLVREYRISSGTFRTPTPLGKFKILEKQELRIGNKAPHYRMPFWQHFSGRGHGFHSLPYLANDNGIFWNEALDHIGRPVSHGCIRILPDDAEDLYNLTKVGTEVVIRS